MVPGSFLYKPNLKVCYSVSPLLVELFKELSKCYVATFPLFTPFRFLVYEQQKQTVTICCKLKLLITMSVLQHLSALNILSVENKNSRKSQQQWHWKFICLCSKRCKIQASRISNCSFPFKKKFAFPVAKSKLYTSASKWSICMQCSYLHKMLLNPVNSKRWPNRYCLSGFSVRCIVGHKGEVVEMLWGVVLLSNGRVVSSSKTWLSCQGGLK